MVSNIAISGMVFQGILSFMLPLVVFIYLRKKHHISLKPVLIGAIIFFVFTQILEKLIHVYVLQVNPTTMDWFENPWLYATYGALMAGIFEEIGRIIGFKFFLKLNRDYKDGLAYGLGHGGIEAIFVGMFASVQFILISVLINSGNFDTQIAASLPGGMADQLKSQLTDTSWHMYYLGGIERIGAFIIQIALSLLVLQGIRKKKNIIFLLAILLHAIIDFSAALVQKQVISIWVVELLLVITVVAAIVFISKIREKMVLTHH
ncbi:YhfC family intramembrane metalloprotease [Neobacillus niacini]|uniref:YhfC family intramembrane metalloprotease n=1 Tax=Neobacillus niacini TaxID=86668 RepID=UPI00285AAC0C|nr:YhfC family intramembrane metalloprotease [Neobacillus niacini]MDR7002733.1 putative membrane protein YhfC [Neobacillus niacini]